MARAYLQRQGQEREPEPVSARPDSPHPYRCYQKQGHQCHHHHHVPLAGDVHAPPPPVCPAGAAPRREVAGAAKEAGGAATSAVGVDEDDPGARPLGISRTRSSQTCRKEGKGLWRVIHVFRWSKVLLRPHKTLSTKT